MVQLLPADVVIVRTPGFWAKVIRLGEMLQGKPDLQNHVAMFHHSAGGVNWYLEGRPGGLGWRAFKSDADSYASSPWTLTNAAQPKTAAQRQAACLYMEGMVGRPYDWEAIEGDAAEALRVPELWPQWGQADQLPGHVVCSSSAAVAYRDALLAAPDGGRFTEPADWSAFIMAEGWLSAPVGM